MGDIKDNSKSQSELVNAVLGGERITSSTGRDTSASTQIKGNTIPRGAVQMTEGAAMIMHKGIVGATMVHDSASALRQSRRTASDGGIPVNFSQEGKDKK